LKKSFSLVALFNTIFRPRDAHMQAGIKALLVSVGVGKAGGKVFGGEQIKAK
jgi:hypothetical protein